jgi:hypothetical protein
VSDEELKLLLAECVSVCGADLVRDRLRALLAVPSGVEDTLTIIANTGVHPIPKEFLRGDVYSASYGNWDVSSQEGLELEFKRILRGLGTKLQERPWQKIYLIPTGHPVLSLQIKVFVYRVSRINTIDLFYSNGKYYEILLDHRAVLLDGDSNGAANSPEDSDKE